MLLDLLEKDLKLIICGTAAGTTSAQKNEYYAGRGNKIWKTLYEIGLTEIELCSSQYRSLLKFNIGLTDIVKGQSGMDKAIDFKKATAIEFKEKMLNLKPDVICFNGKKAARVFYSRHDLVYGLQPGLIGDSKVFIAPSTSAAATRYWKTEYWKQLADCVPKRS
jgi:double-stranded uracil-DNA glycosylase